MGREEPCRLISRCPCRYVPNSMMCRESRTSSLGVRRTFLVLRRSHGSSMNIGRRELAWTYALRTSTQGIFKGESFMLDLLVARLNLMVLASSGGVASDISSRVFLFLSSQRPGGFCAQGCVNRPCWCRSIGSPLCYNVMSVVSCIWIVR